MENSVRLVNVVLRLIVTTMIYVVYLVLVKLCCVINCVFNAFIGKSAENNAKLRMILWRRNISRYHTSSPMDFLCVFSSRVIPEFVLRPNVSLYCITKKEAIFVETAGNVNIYSSDENPFLYLACT